jgi:hypothetical protein
MLLIQLFKTNSIKNIVVIGLMFFSSNAWSGLILDTASTAALSTAASKFIVLAKKMSNIADNTSKSQRRMKSVISRINAIEKQLRENATKTLAWRNKYTPNLRYNKVIIDLYLDLEKIDLKNKKELEAIEDNSFNSAAALTNMADQYSGGNLIYKKAMKDKAMCPNPKANKETYIDLQLSSCLIVYNTEAYKSKLIEVSRQKHDAIEKATKQLLKLKDKKTGDLNSKKDALTAIQFFRRKMMYEYQVGMDKAQTQSEIANDTRKYATSAVVVGAPSSYAVDISMAATKLAIAGIFLLTPPPSTPYNQ